MNKKLLLSLFTVLTIGASSVASAQNYLTESFDGSTFPPTGWSRTAGTGTSDGGGCGCTDWEQTSYGFSYPTPGTHTGAGMAGYNSWDISSGGHAELISPALNFATYAGGANQVSFWYYGSGTYDYVNIYANTSASLTGATLVGTVYSYDVSGWAQLTYSLPSTSTFTSSSTVYVIFEAVSDYQNDQYIDDVSIDHIPPCSGATSIAITTQAHGVCSGNSFTMTATTTPALISGVGYQWQKATTPAGPWTNIAGATTTSLTTSVTTAAYFRIVDTCRSVGAVSISNVDTVTINSAALCPCKPAYYYPTFYSSAACDWNIDDFQITGTSPSSISDGALACGGPGTDSYNGYYDRTMDTVSMTQGGTYNGSMDVDYGYYDDIALWIDFNDDGVFQSTEMVSPVQGNGCCGSYITNWPFTVDIPLTAPLGPHRMRVRYGVTYDSNPPVLSTDADPCNYNTSTYSFYYYQGATRDYVANILQAPACSGMPSATAVPAGPQTLCSGVSDTLTATIPSPVTGLTYQWQSSNSGGVTWSNISGATNKAYIFTVSAPLWYRCVVTCSNSGLSTNTNIVIVNTNPACPCTPTYTSTSPSSFYAMYQVQVTGYAGSNINDYPSTSTTTGYDDRTSVVSPVDMLQGGSYSGSLSFYFYYQSASIWIDFNDDGTFSSSELMAGPTATTSCCSFTTTRNFTLNIPSAANTGIHRMRVRDVYYCCSTPSSIDPCNSYGYGNTADYLVNIESLEPVPALSPDTTQTLCVGSTISITASTTATGTLTYNWTGPNGFVSSTTTTASSNTINITGAAFANSGAYTVRVTSSTGTSNPATDTVYVWPYPVFLTGSPTSNSPVCTPNPLQLTAEANPANATWSWSGPASFSSSSVDPVIDPTDASMSGTYTVTVSNHGCNTSANTTATVHQTPSIASISGSNPTSCSCNCGSFTLTGLNASTAYTVNYHKNGLAATASSVTTDASGNLTVTGLSAALYDSIMVTLNACPSAPASIMLTNPSAPATPIASSNSPVCQNSTLSFTASDATAGVSWTWNGPNSFSSSISSPSRSSVPLADSGTYYVFVTDGSGCTSNVVTLNVIVKPVPANPVASSNSPVCQGTALNFTSSASTPGITYSWTGPGFPSGSTMQNPTINNVPLSAAGLYTVYSVLNGCQSTLPATVSVYVKWTPGTPLLTTNSPVCAGMGYNPNYLIMNVSDTSSGVTYTWSGPNAFSVVDDPATTQTITNPPALDAGDYTVYATLNGCISAFSTSTVIIKPTPTPPVVSPAKFVYCQFEPTTVLTATGTSLRWYTVQTGGVSAASIIPQDSIAGLYVYYTTQTVNNCQSQPAPDTVLVKTKPLPPAALATYTYCQGDNAVPIAAIGVNLLWYTSPAGGTGSPITPTPSTAAAGTFDYYVTQTVNGCESDRKHVVINIKTKPNPPAVTNPLVYCQGDIATPLVAGGVNLLWYNVSSGGVGSPIAPTPVTSYPQDTAYYFVTQTVNGCQSDRAEIDVYTYYKPNAIIIGSAPYVCQYDTLNFRYYGNGTSDAAYNWTMPKGASIVGGYGQGPITARFDSAGHYKVILSVDNHGCKSPLTSYTVDVRLAPIVPLVMNNQVCQGDLVNVSTGVPNETIDNYNWDFAGAQVVYGANGAGPYGIRFGTQGMFVVKLIATANLCPSAELRDTVYVHPQGDAHIQFASNTNVCSGDSVHFTSENYNPAYLYQWLPASYFHNITNTGEVYGFIDKSGFVKLQVTTEYGCTSEDSIQINAQACCDVFFPNAFTPNGDGKNDIFRPVSNGHQQIKDFRVLNRWGQTMFQSVDQRNGWDGKFGGVPQDLGTYYYFIKYVCANGKTYEQKGEIILIR